MQGEGEQRERTARLVLMTRMFIASAFVLGVILLGCDPEDSSQSEKTPAEPADNNAPAQHASVPKAAPGVPKPTKPQDRKVEFFVAERGGGQTKVYSVAEGGEKTLVAEQGTEGPVAVAQTGNIVAGTPGILERPGGEWKKLGASYLWRSVEFSSSGELLVSNLVTKKGDGEIHLADVGARKVKDTLPGFGAGFSVDGGAIFYLKPGPLVMVGGGDAADCAKPGAPCVPGDFTVVRRAKGEERVLKKLPNEVSGNAVFAPVSVQGLSGDDFIYEVATDHGSLYFFSQGKPFYQVEGWPRREQSGVVFSRDLKYAAFEELVVGVDRYVVFVDLAKAKRKRVPGLGASPRFRNGKLVYITPVDATPEQFADPSRPGTMTRVFDPRKFKVEWSALFAGAVEPL